MKKKLIILLAISVASTNLYAQQGEEPEVKIIKYEPLEQETMSKKEAVEKFDKALEEKKALQKIKLLGEIVNQAPGSFYKIKTGKFRLLRKSNEEKLKNVIAKLKRHRDIRVTKHRETIIRYVGLIDSAIENPHLKRYQDDFLKIVHYLIRPYFRQLKKLHSQYLIHEEVLKKLPQKIKGKETEKENLEENISKLEEKESKTPEESRELERLKRKLSRIKRWLKKADGTLKESGEKLEAAKNKRQKVLEKMQSEVGDWKERVIGKRLGNEIDRNLKDKLERIIHRTIGSADFFEKLRVRSIVG